MRSGRVASELSARIDKAAPILASCEGDVLLAGNGNEAKRAGGRAAAAGMLFVGGAGAASDHGARAIGLGHAGFHVMLGDCRSKAGARGWRGAPTDAQVCRSWQASS